MHKTSPALAIATVLLIGCTPFNTVPLYKDYTAYQSFLQEREACVREAHQCIQKTYAETYYQGESVERLLPSRGVYLACMSSRGYYATPSGFVPPVLVKMTDYPRGQDCSGR